MAKTIQIQQRFPEPLLSAIDDWANHIGTRTAAINYMCSKFLEDIEIERLKAENADLRAKLVKVVMDRCPPPGTPFVITTPDRGEHHKCDICPQKVNETDCVGECPD